MKMISLYNLNKLANAKNEPLLIDSNLINIVPFMQGYVDSYPSFDDYISKQYVNFYPTWNLQYCFNDESVYASFRNSVLTYLLTNKDSYQKMYDALELVYEPIENYNRVEEEVIDRTGTDINSNLYGELKTIKNFGDQTTTDTYGNQNNSTERNVYGFNSTSASKDSIENETIGSKTDSRTESAREDTETTSGRTDTLTNTKNLKDVRTNKMHGNIGVTTSQQMLESEITLRLKYSFYNMLFSDIIRNLCNLYDSGYDSFDVIESEEIKMSANTTGLKIELDTTTNGVTINIKEDGETVESATVYNGTTPEFKIDNGDLYVNYKGV